MFVTQQMAEVVDLGQARRRKAVREQEPWSDKKTAALHFGVSVRTIENWIVGKYVGSKMPHYKRFEGSPVKFKLSECDEWYERECALAVR